MCGVLVNVIIFLTSLSVFLQVKTRFLIRETGGTNKKDCLSHLIHKLILLVLTFTLQKHHLWYFHYSMDSISMFCLVTYFHYVEPYDMTFASMVNDMNAFRERGYGWGRGSERICSSNQFPSSLLTPSHTPATVHQPDSDLFSHER